jgi:3-hydroxybutyryl-CoA dehydrogenase
VAEVQTIAVIGAGRVGRGIAQVAARGGYRTILEDLLPNALRRAESEIRSQLDWAVESGGVSADAADAALSRLEFAGSVEDAARQADLVIEAVPEELESKIEIFTLLDKICRPGTILASHISTLSITEISRVTYRARNCVGMHFAEPVGSERRLEIIRGQETDDATVAVAVEVGRRMGKETLVLLDPWARSEGLPLGSL